MRRHAVVVDGLCRSVGNRIDGLVGALTGPPGALAVRPCTAHQRVQFQLPDVVRVGGATPDRQQRIIFGRVIRKRVTHEVFCGFCWPRGRDGPAAFAPRDGTRVGETHAR